MKVSWRAKTNSGTSVLVKPPDEYYIPENNIHRIQVEEFNKCDTIHVPTSSIRLNKLEAVIVPLTSREITTNTFQKFADNILLTTSSARHLYMILFVNNADYKKSDVYPTFLKTIRQLKKVFKNIFVVNLKLEKDDDIYSLTATGEFIPKYGCVSGPNLLFLGAMNFCKRFNTVLLLETDCILKEDWVVACDNYVTYGGTFLISGSTYDGIGNLHLHFKNPAPFFHINGVAFYNTGSDVFQKVISELDRYLIYYAKNVSPINAYDIVLTYMIFDQFNQLNNFKFWKYVYRNIVKNTLIINCSLHMDKSISIHTIHRLFPSCVILHKK
jgi:hypothetical protein